MHTIAELQQLFSDYIRENRFTQLPQELYQPNNYFLGIGGKRLRPVLMLLCTELFGGNYKNSIDAAIATEYFHNFTLIHDDIMDNAPLRRGFETLHEKYNTTTAILSGDVLLIYAYKYLSNIDKKHFKQVFDIFTETAIEVCEGQQYDINFENSEDVQEEEYINMIRLKTAVLFAASLKIGAILGNASPTDADLIYNYGINLGIAFQIQDDILDCYGNTAEVGKQLAGDIVQNKKTILLIEALQQSKKDNDDCFKDLLKEQDDKTKIKGVLEIYEKYGIKAYTIERRDYYVSLAVKNLNRISLPEDKRTTLFNLIDTMVYRNL